MFGIDKKNLKSIEAIDAYLSKYRTTMGRKLFVSHIMLMLCVSYLLTSAVMLKFPGGNGVAALVCFVTMSLSLMLRSSYNLDWASLQVLSVSARLDIVENVADLEYRADSIMFQGKPLDAVRAEKIKKAIREANDSV